MISSDAGMYLGRMLNNPGLNASFTLATPPSYSDQAAMTPRSLQSGAQRQMQLSNSLQAQLSAGQDATVGGRVSLGMLSVILLTIMVFAYWTRQYQK